jgi:hypothetical protein
MNKIILTVLLFYSSYSFGQKVYAKDHMPATLNDTITKCTYVLDSSHTLITAFNSSGNVIWTVRPKLDSSIFCKLEIAAIGFYTEPRIENEKPVADKEMWFSYCKCGGYINLRTGKSQMIGCD